jgi:hypothetical protein
LLGIFSMRRRIKARRPTCDRRHIRGINPTIPYNSGNFTHIWHGALLR